GLRGFAQDRCPMALIRRVTARAAIVPHVPMAVGPELAPGRCARVPHRRPLPCSAWMPDDVSRRGGGGAMAMAVVRRVTARAAIAPHVPMAVGPELAPGRCARVPHRRPLPCSAWMPDDVSRRGGGGAMAMAVVRRVTARAAIAPHVPMAVGPELAPGRCARVPHRRPLPCSAWMPDDVSRRGGGGAMAMAVVRRATARAAVAPHVPMAVGPELAPGRCARVPHRRPLPCSAWMPDDVSR